MIDLRSDTLTRPSPAMLEYMMSAQVGDDVFNEDPTVNELQTRAAEMFNVEAALFCPSGTMTNQIAVKIQTEPGDEVICHEGAHVHYYEGGGMAINSAVTTKALLGERGILKAEHIVECLRPTNVHFPRTSLVCLENTSNRGGGKVFPMDDLEKIREVCSSKGLNMHLDGARLFNAIIADGTKPSDYGNLFDTISICLSKGLGAPVGSLLLGNHQLISKAYRVRKWLGGGMRQAGILAAGGLYALENNVSRLRKDHDLASAISSELKNHPFVSRIESVETNIVIFELDKRVNCSSFLKYLEVEGVKAFEVGPQRIRFVTHMDLPSNTLESLSRILSAYSSSVAGI